MLRFQGLQRLSTFSVLSNRKATMKLTVSMICTLLALGTTGAMAQNATPLTNYVDANGFLDVQALTCAQLADTYQQDADALTAWYSGWYNGLAKKHFYDPNRTKKVEHEVIVYCKAHRDKKIIEAIAVVFKDERAKLGIKMK
jgi:hypothetical protein